MIILLKNRNRYLKEIKFGPKLESELKDDNIPKKINY